MALAGDNPLQTRRDVVAAAAILLRGLDHGDLSGLTVFGAPDRDEIDLRLAGPLLVLTQLHKVDQQGRCRRCRPARAHKLRWLPRPRRQAPCQVLKVAKFFSSAPLEEVWMLLLPRLGIRRGLDKIRAQLADRATERDVVGTIPVPLQLSQPGRHALYDHGINI